MSSFTTDLQPFCIKDEIWVEEITPSYPMIHIRNAHATAIIALHGAHLTHYARREEIPIIFTSQAAIFREGKAIRGGIPICWPWFGAHPDPEKNLPAHGYARISFWKLVSTASDINGTHLTFALPQKEGSDLAAIIEFTIGKELTLRLTSSNLGTTDEIISEALHSYFAVNSAQQTQILGLDGSHYTDTTVQPPTINQQSGPVDFPDEIDRIYSGATDLIVDDKGNSRRIIVKKSGSRSTIMWNPGQEKGSAMTDLLDEEVTQFICAESGNALKETITLTPGGTHTLSLTISSET